MGVVKRLSGRTERGRKEKYMIRVHQVKLPIPHSEEQFRKKLAQTLRVPEGQIQKYEIRKQSLDARKKPQLFYSYTVDVSVPKEAQVLKRLKESVAGKAPKNRYQFPESGTETLRHRPVIVGCGPAGLLCGYMLALHGYRPILIERGAPVEERMKDVEMFWQTGYLDPDSNVQFGEGGAGTFSDGKLNTLVKDPNGRGAEVLRIFAEHGAPKDICYVNKPHIGTDILTKVVRNMREFILKHGGDVFFHTQMTDIDINRGQVCGIMVKHLPEGKDSYIETEVLILAPGHSARDTFFRLYERGVAMEPKSFAVGVRAEHPQKMINRAQYGEQPEEIQQYLGAAAYKVTANLDNGRGVYSFCMCPGGYVVNASSEEEMLAVNGMSYRDRAGENANSAIVVTVSPEDYGAEDALAGIRFQRELERRAYEAGKGKIPVERLEDFLLKTKTPQEVAENLVHPQMKGEYCVADVRGILPEFIGDAIAEGMSTFGQKIRGFDHPDTLLSGVESRTSSPVRIPRDADMQHQIRGLFPCGEGAGYAGGITSAAIDGLKIAEIIAAHFQKWA